MTVEELIKVLEKHKEKTIETLCLGLIVETDNDEEENAVFAVIGTGFKIAAVMSELVNKITSREGEQYGEQSNDRQIQ